MKLVIAEKPSVAMSLAAVLGANEKKDGYLEGGSYLVSFSQRACKSAAISPTEYASFLTA